jgi:hypothetical protein
MKTRAYPSRLARTWLIGLVIAFGWLPLKWLVCDSPMPTLQPLEFLYFLLLWVAPIPAVASATLLIRDFGWRRGLLGAPAAVLALTVAGVWHVVAITIEQGR